MLFHLAATVFAAAFALTAAAQAQRVQEPTSVAQTVATDHFAAGGSVRIGKPIEGDLFAVGGNVDVDSAVGGDAVVAGGNVRIGAPVAQSVYAAGGQLVINSPIGRNARIAGGQVEIDRRAQVAGNVSVAGGQVRIEGHINGYVRAGGGSVIIDGPVDGDVVSTAGSVELGPNARIGGQLRFASRDDLSQHPGAQVLGGIERLPFAARRPTEKPQPAEIGRSLGWAWTTGLLLIAVVLSVALPEPARRVAETLRARPLMSLLIGFIALVCIPVAALIVLLTVIGVPLALLAAVLYFALLLIGYVGSGIGVGQWALHRFKPARAAQRSWLAAFAAVGMLAIALLGRLPWIGGPIVFVALLAGVGALALQFARHPQSA